MASTLSVDVEQEGALAETTRGSACLCPWRSDLGGRDRWRGVLLQTNVRVE